MKATATGCCAAAAMFGLVAVVGAQRPNGAPAQTAGPTVTDQIKATGCLSKDANGNYMLNNAAIEVTPWYAPNATVVAGPPSAFPSKTAFVLKNGTNLESHLGHKIEVTGKPSPASATVAPGSDTVVPPPAPVPPALAGAAVPPGFGGAQRTYAPPLEVQAVKMVSATCP